MAFLNTQVAAATAVVHRETAYELGIAPSGQLAGMLGRPAAPPAEPGEATDQRTAAVPAGPAEEMG